MLRSRVTISTCRSRLICRWCSESEEEEGEDEEAEEDEEEAAEEGETRRNSKRVFATLAIQNKLISWRWTDEEEEAAGDEEEEEEAAAPGAGQPEAKLATPEEVAMALHHAKQRQIQGQQFPDTLVDATNGQPLHVPGVPGSAHNGVSGVGGIFGVGGLLGPDEPMAMRESEALTLGPSCTCAKCVGSPPVCSGCTCRRR